MYLSISKLCSQNPNSVFIENEYQCSYLTIGQIHYSSLNKVQFQSDVKQRIPMWLRDNRVAESARRGEGASSIAKDLIDSDTLFCRETAFVTIYALFQG